jgi:hypothetical protein
MIAERLINLTQMRQASVDSDDLEKRAGDGIYLNNVLIYI